MDRIHAFIDFELLLTSKISLQCDFYQIFNMFISRLGNVTISIVCPLSDKERFCKAIGAHLSSLIEIDYFDSCNLSNSCNIKSSAKGLIKNTTGNKFGGLLKVSDQNFSSICRNGLSSYNDILGVSEINDSKNQSSTSKISFNVAMKRKYKYIYCFLISHHELALNTIPINIDYFSNISTSEYTYIQNMSNIFWFNIISEIKNMLYVLANSLGNVAGNDNSSISILARGPSASVNDHELYNLSDESFKELMYTLIKQYIDRKHSSNINGGNDTGSCSITATINAMKRFNGEEVPDEDVLNSKIKEQTAVDIMNSYNDTEIIYK